MLELLCSGCGAFCAQDQCAGVGFWPFTRAHAVRALCLQCIERVPVAERRVPQTTGDVVLSRHEHTARLAGTPKWIMDATDMLFAIREPVARALFPRLFRRLDGD